MDARESLSEKSEAAVGSSIAHDSATLHVSGRASYTDDIPEPRGLLHLAVGMSGIAHGELRAINLANVETAADVVATVTAADIRGDNNCGSMVADDPIFATDKVEYVGQSVFAVAATSANAARKAARNAELDCHELEAILDPMVAVEKESFVLPSETMLRGDPGNALSDAPNRLARRVSVGGQDQFYLEGQIAMVVPQEGSGLLVYSSTQHPDEIQSLVAHATSRQASDVTVICRRMGGAFGGKETQAGLIACIAAVAADKTGKPCKLRLDRDDDMMLTGKRHDFVIDYDVGFDDSGRILGIEFEMASRCGMSADLSGPVNDRAMFSSDNAYFLENVRIVSHRCKTNTVSNTAFRGFGGPQGMFAIEYVIDDIARTLNIDPLVVRQRNYYGKTERNVTHYGQVIEDNIIEELTNELLTSSDYEARREEIAAFNLRNKILKRGIAITPVKFGISFTSTLLNQAGALVHVYKDGTVQLNHGGTEMGQGLHTKVAQVVADEFQIGVDQIRVMATYTSKVPNASATAASSGADLNAMAAKRAAAKIRARLTEVAANHFSVTEAEIQFANNVVSAGDNKMTFAELTQLAWVNRVSLSSTGFYKTPKINYDRSTFSGRPFYYFAYGAAVSEVVVDTLTGENRTLRVDILHDCGKSLNPAVDIGQIEGGFIQGAGWLTSEELWWNDKGVLGTHAPSTYKIPTCSDLAPDFRVQIMQSVENVEDTIYRSKAVGEPPLMLALSVFHAIRDAIASDHNPLPALRAPATPESILNALESTAYE